MKVGDLEVGMMITPIKNKWTDKRMNFNLHDLEMTGIDSKSGDEIFKNTLVCDITSHMRPEHPSIGIYMGSKKSDYWMNGVKTHHHILVGNSLAKISGYEFRWIEPVK